MNRQLEIEYWMDVDEYEGLYEVSSLGKVRSKDRIIEYSNGSIHRMKGRMLKPATSKKGYLRVALSKDSKMKSYTVHRLVAQAFIDNPYGLKEINHKNEDKTDNRVENLEWCDSKYNNNYGSRIEKVSKPVQAFNKNTGELVYEFKSTADAGRYGFDQATVSACCLGKCKSHKGLIWSYNAIEKIFINR